MPTGIYPRNSSMRTGKYVRNNNMRTGKYIRTASMKTGKYIRTLRMRKNISVGTKEYFKKNPIALKRLSETAMKNTRRGPDSNFWRGGISKHNLTKQIRTLYEYKKWRSDVFQRDGWTCKTCGKNSTYVVAHHKIAFSYLLHTNLIKSTQDAIKCPLLWDVNNGVTLCLDCHKLTDNYGYKINKRKED